MTQHMLTPLRSKRESGHLVLNAVPDATQAALFLEGAVPAGRCMHLVRATGSGVMAAAKLGIIGNAKVPAWIYRPSDSYSAGFPGPEPTIENGPSWNTGMEGGILMYVGLEGFELMTTEYDKSQTYFVGDYLLAPEHDLGAGDPVAHARDIAGVATKVNAVFGASTIVGMVSPGLYGQRYDEDGRDPFRNQVLSFYTTYRPPVAGIVTGTPTNLTAGR